MRKKEKKKQLLHLKSIRYRRLQSPSKKKEREISHGAMFLWLACVLQKMTANFGKANNKKTDPILKAIIDVETQFEFSPPHFFILSFTSNGKQCIV